MRQTLSAFSVFAYPVLHCSPGWWPLYWSCFQLGKLRRQEEVEPGCKPRQVASFNCLGPHAYMQQALNKRSLHTSPAPAIPPLALPLWEPPARAAWRAEAPLKAPYKSSGGGGFPRQLGAVRGLPTLWSPDVPAPPGPGGGLSLRSLDQKGRQRTPGGSASIRRFHWNLLSSFAARVGE